MRKQVVEHHTKPLPPAMAERLQGYNGNPDQFAINIFADLIRSYLRKNYGPVDKWLSPLQRMMNNRDITPCELVAVKRVIQEVDGVEG